MTLKEKWESMSLSAMDVAAMARLSLPTVYKMNKKETVSNRSINDLCKALNITRSEYDGFTPDHGRV